MELKDQIKQLRESSKKRNFNQRVDIIINLKDFNLNKPENKIDEVFMLPKGSGKPAKITLFADNIKATEGCTIFKKSDIEKLSKNKKDLKKTISETNFFLAEPPLMPVVGKFLGKYLAPIGKMPKPLVGDPKKMIETFQKGVRIEAKKEPVIKTIVGSEKMSDDDLAANIQAAVNFIKTKLPKGKNNLRSIKLKFTMSKPIALEVG
jgi:large subunit ribosomal protein L1